MAEALLRHHGADLGVDLSVHSAGILRSGQPASSSSVDLLNLRGIDLSAHRSTKMTTEALLGADLVLGMAREHVREAAVLAPAAWPRSFALKALVRTGEKLGPRRADETPSDWLARVHQLRSPADMMGSSPEDDVADPIGQPRAAYQRMVAELDDLVDRLAALLWPAEWARR